MNTAETLVIVDPAAEDAMDQTSTARRLPGLAGMHIGMIDNSKHMADALLIAVEGLLKERHQVARVTRFRKSNPSVPTPPAVFAGQLASCDAIVHGVAD